MKKPLILLIISIVLGIAGLYIQHHYAGYLNPAPGQQSQSAPNTSTTNTQNTQPANKPANSPTPPTNGIVPPIRSAGSRITKKFFGTYVTPQNSPVKPERFTGFHTGLDFETTSEEANTDVQIYAICEGKLLVKGYASGYGGYAVQNCAINGQTVAVVYGHLRQSSITPAVGTTLTPGKALAVLGTGFSKETDGERKHLHLGIHIGGGVNIKGYVQNKSELSGWMDPKAVLNL